MSDLLTASVLFAAASVYAVCFSAVVALVCVGVARLIPWVEGWRLFWVTGMICASLPGFMALVPRTPAARAPGDLTIPSLGTGQWVPIDLLVDAPRDVDWWLVLCQVWLCLYLIVLCVKSVAQFRAHIRLRRLIAASVRLPEDVAEVVWEAVGSSQHRRRLEVIASAQADSPFVAGFFRCVLVLPRRILEVVNRDQLVFVIKHELAHVDACDTVVLGTARWLSAVWWFNPFLRALFRRLHLAAELSCDEEALHGASASSRSAYAESLLQILRQIQLRCRRDGAISAWINLTNGDGAPIRQRLMRIAAPARGPRTLTYAILILSVAVPANLIAGYVLQPNVPLTPYLDGGWQRPLGSTGKVTSRFGPRDFPGLDGMHRGLDIAAPMGTEVRAVAAGVVLWAEDNSDFGYGTYILLDHGRGLKTRYAHLSASLVRRGQRVARGSLIGLVGATGNTTGPHLHFEVLLHGEATDPEPYLILKEESAR